MKFQTCVNGVLIATSFIVALRPSLMCDFIDFNVQEFKLLGFENIILSTFSTKKYTNETEIGPFQRDSEYYMTFSPAGIISGQTVETYDLDMHSVIEMAYYFNSTLGMAADFLFIIISPSFTRHSQVHPHTKPGWRIIREIVNTTVTDARIKLTFGSSSRITFMVEYIKISNSNSNQPNCLIETSTGSTLSTTDLISTTFQDSSISSTASTVSSIVTTLDPVTERYMSNITIENSSAENESEQPTIIFERTTESTVTLEFTPEHSSASFSNEDSTRNTEYSPNYSSTILNSTPYDRSTVSPLSSELISIGSTSTILSVSTVSDISKLIASFDSTTIPNEPNTADSSTITEIEEITESTRTTLSVTTTNVNTTQSICSTQDCSIIIPETTTPGRSTVDYTTESKITNSYSTNSMIATEDISSVIHTTPAANTSIIVTTNLTTTINSTIPLDTTTSTITNDLTISTDSSDSTDKNEIIIYPLTTPASSTITTDFNTKSFITNSTFSTGSTINDISTKILPGLATSTVTITEPTTISNSTFDYSIKSDSTTDVISTISSGTTDSHSTKPSVAKESSTSMTDTSSTGALNLITGYSSIDSTGFSMLPMTGTTFDLNIETTTPFHLPNDLSTSTYSTLTGESFTIATDSKHSSTIFIDNGTIDNNSLTSTVSYVSSIAVATNSTTETDPNNSISEFHKLPFTTNSGQTTVSEKNDNTLPPPSTDIKTTDLTDPPALEGTAIVPEQILAGNSVNEIWMFIAILSIVLFCIAFTGGIYTCLSVPHTMKTNVQQPVDEIRIDVMNEEQNRGLTSLPRLAVSRTPNDELWIHNADLAQSGTTNSVNNFLWLKDKRI